MMVNVVIIKYLTAIINFRLMLFYSSSDIYRLNLENGRYQTCFVSRQSTEINKVIINQVHGLILTGGKGGNLEAWDPRCGDCIASLDCALPCLLNKGRYVHIVQLSYQPINFILNVSYIFAVPM